MDMINARNQTVLRQIEKDYICVLWNRSDQDNRNIEFHYDKEVNACLYLVKHSIETKEIIK